MKLIAKEVKDKELLFRLMHEKGATFYRYVKETDEYEIVYYSNEKFAYFIGKLSEEELKTKIFPFGFKVEQIVYDEATGEVKIRQ